MTALLDVRGLSVAFGRSIALAGVDLIAPLGAVVGILGPNGAGKSTLLNAIAGTLAPRAGTITFDGEQIDGRPAHEVARRGVCLIPEHRGILPALTVADNLKLALGDDTSAQGRVLQRFPILADRREQPAGTLSGGEQQMLALARAFRASTRLLMVDEPSLGLAPRVVSMIEAALVDIHRERRGAIVWVEQYAHRLLALADVVYILGRGRVVWAGDPSELRASPVLIKTYLGGVA